MKKELRGLGAVEYADKQGILFDIDEDYMLEAEAKLLGRPATKHDLENVFYQKLGHCYDPTELLPGEPSFDLLVERYGGDWIVVPLQGNHPEREEEAALSIFHTLLDEEVEPCAETNIIDLFHQYLPKLDDTGFPPWADLSLLFHAALRLTEKGVLTSKVERPAEGGTTIGLRQFTLPPDLTFSVALCEECHSQLQYSSPDLHRRCAVRLQKVLNKVLPRAKRTPVTKKKA